MNILEELSAMRRADAQALEKLFPLETLETALAGMPPPPSFRKAFQGDGVNVIAELKKASPSKGLIRADFKPVPLARELEAAGAAALSCLCEPHKFLGSEEYLRAAARAVKIPVLYKDFVTTPYQIARARVAGAAAVLLIAAVLPTGELARLVAVAHGYGLDALVETHTESEIESALAAGAGIIGVNCRDLKTFRTDPAITANLIGKIPPDRVRIAESGMRTAEDLRALRAAGADGFLVGETLMRAPDPAGALGEIMG